MTQLRLLERSLRLSLFAFLFVSCWIGFAPQTAGATTADLPPIPLYVSIDHFGQMSVTSGIPELPILAGHFSKNPTVSQLQKLGERLLILRFDNKYSIYNLKSHPVFLMVFDRGFYRAVQMFNQGENLVLEVERSLVRIEAPNSDLLNRTAVKVQAGRRSCLETKFHSRMWGIVLNAVRLRKEPYIPMELDINWVGSLRTRENVYILLTYCNAGSWLKIERASGSTGWAKEWGLNEELVEKTFISPDPTK